MSGLLNSVNSLHIAAIKLVVVCWILTTFMSTEVMDYPVSAVPNGRVRANNTRHASPCMTDDNITISVHHETWTSGCGVKMCILGYFGYNYTVSYTCKEIASSYNPDPINCNITANVDSEFPDCCPYLLCPDRHPNYLDYI